MSVNCRFYVGSTKEPLEAWGMMTHVPIIGDAVKLTDLNGILRTYHVIVRTWISHNLLHIVVALAGDETP